ncbi:MAG: hypothetical protein LBS23_00745 [Holosporaceae bacterium]|jgi:hypothetical protein|nr:hypothetical protein [Holosporaceae bacterium]
MRKLSSIDEQKFPNPNGGEDVIWNGEKFVGKQTVASDVLAYPMSNSRMGWNDDLTTFHEEMSNGEHPIDKASFDLAIRNLKKYYFSLPNRGGADFRNRLFWWYFTTTVTSFVSIFSNCRCRYYCENIT